MEKISVRKLNHANLHIQCESGTAQELREFFCRWFDDTLAGVTPDEQEEIFNRLLEKGLIKLWQ